MSPSQIDDRDLQWLEDLVMSQLDHLRDFAEPEIEAVDGASRIVDDVHVLDAHAQAACALEFKANSGVHLAYVL